MLKYRCKSVRRYSKHKRGTKNLMPYGMRPKSQQLFNLAVNSKLQYDSNINTVKCLISFINLKYPVI
ncbi:MAG TPA: hypothetical protein DCO83_01410 [Mucilaginibacter sp.]|nr:hypothetical protein [Mucilaginibacter sp.]